MRCAIRWFSTRWLGACADEHNYAERTHAAQQQTAFNDALVSGSGTIDGVAIGLAVGDFRFLGGSMGSVYGEKIARAAERAAARVVPLLTVNTSGGARMYEGMFSLLQMAKVSVALDQLSAARQIHIALLTDPCYGGVTASYASAAGVVLAEPGARIGFTGRCIIEQTIKQQLSSSFQTAEFLLEHGMIDAVVARADLRTVIGKLLQIHQLSAYAPERIC